MRISEITIDRFCAFLDEPSGIAEFKFDRTGLLIVAKECIEVER